MRKLHFIQAIPDDLVFIWQTQVQLANFTRYGYADKARVLIFQPNTRSSQNFSSQWKVLERQFPTTQFFYYRDQDNFTNTFRALDYIPLLRPYILKRHLQEFPELEQDALFYHDSDVIFTKYLDFSPFLADDTIYLSYTGNRTIDYNYISKGHFEDKLNNLNPILKETAIAIDPLKKLLELFGLPKERFTKAPLDTIGGAQSLLKNVNAEFFDQLIEKSIQVKHLLAHFNQQYMNGADAGEKERNGFQSWAADMWALLFLFWQRGDTTHCPPNLDFLWATDDISKWDQFYIYHDAGGGSNNTFNKRAIRYVNNVSTPFYDDLSWVNKQTCSYNYCKEISYTKNTYNP